MTAAAFTRTGDQAASSSYALPLLGVLALGLALGYAGVRLWRRHQRRRVEAVRQERAVAWEEVVRRIKMKQALAASEPGARRLQQIDVR
jgi:NhaP-type Na+/H+ or K+/H+ antiporter